MSNDYKYDPVKLLVLLEDEDFIDIDSRITFMLACHMPKCTIKAWDNNKGEPFEVNDDDWDFQCFNYEVIVPRPDKIKRLTAEDLPKYFHFKNCESIYYSICYKELLKWELESRNVLHCSWMPCSWEEKHVKDPANWRPFHTVQSQQPLIFKTE